MNCAAAAEFVSALYDGERIPREAAEHLGECNECRSRLAAYSAIGAELRREARILEPNEVPERQWEPRQKVRSSWWTKSRESMRIPRFAFALMLVAIFLLSGGLMLVRARPNQTGSVLWLAVKLPFSDKVFHSAIATDGEPGSDGFGHFSIVPAGGMFSMNARFLRRQGERVELAVKTRYENPTPHFSGPQEARLDGIPEQDVWVEPGQTAEVSVPGLGPIQFAGDFLDHKPPSFFSPDDTVDPKANEFRIFSPVLIRGKEMVFNEAGASSSGDDFTPGSGVTVYWPGEGLFLFSPAPFKGAVQGSVFESQVKFKLDGQDCVLLTAVPVTREKHIWIKHDSLYKPSAHNPGSSDDQAFLGGGDSKDFPQE